MDKLTQLINRYQDIIADGFHAWEETVDQLVTDGIITKNDIVTDDEGTFVELFDVINPTNDILELTPEATQEELALAKVYSYGFWLTTTNSVDEEFDAFFGVAA